ncbi:MAG TPA: BatA domain-containing protein [Tepidisphaeraceae bacterium]|nr:BatA domain-containing protein [Tepidisphaeraceae bacterium]
MSGRALLFIVHRSSFIVPMQSASNILAFSFLSPSFAIAGLVLASLPIIIHILNRRRFKTIDWAAMDFLLRAMRKNRKRLRFEQWLLLATRCLVLALLGFALARPLSCSENSMAGVGQRTGLHVIVLDNSYSMAYEADRPNAKTHFEHAKKLIEQMIDQLAPGGESIAVITAARPATAVLAKPTYDLQQARAAVDRIAQTEGGTDLAGALRLAIDVGRENEKQANKNLYLLTDATRSAWQTPESEAVKFAGQELAELYHITNFNLSKGRQWNQAVLDVRPGSNLVTAKSNFGSEFLADVKGFGDARDATIQWRLDGNVLPGGGTVHLAADTPPQTQSQAVIKTGGPHVVTVSLLGDDRLKLDNTRSRVVNVASELKVLIVEGQRSTGPLGGSGAFLQLALAPPRDGATSGNASQSDSYIAPELISDLELSNRVLTDYRAVLLCGVGQIQPAQADQLQHFVEAGGTLILFMGEPVSSDNYNSVLLPRKLMPGPLTKRMNAGADQRGFVFDFNPNGVLHPLLKAFANQEKTGLDTAQVYTYWQADVPNDPQIRVLNYRAADGASTRPGGASDPAITINTLGRGRVVFVSTTANADWTTLPAKPAYVALMQELLSGSINAGDAWMNLAVGQRLDVPTNIKFTSTPTLVDPQSKVIPLEPTTTADGSPSFRSPPLNAYGVYTLATANGNVPVAVNVPAADEADVQTIDDAAIKSALGGIDAVMADDQLPRQAESVTAGNDLGWNVMGVVMIFVALEAFLAMRFGHYRRK